MIPTFIALLTEQSTTEMKYRRNKADIFYLKVLLTSNVTVGTQKGGQTSIVLVFLSPIFNKAVKMHFTSDTGEMSCRILKGH